MAPDNGRVDDVIRGVRDLIRAEALRIGDRLPSETTLAERFDVSRPVVREAFRSLAALRVITMSAGRRAVVAELAAGPLAIMLDHAVSTRQFPLDQIYEMRSAIELRGTDLAAARRTPERETELRDLARQFEEARDDADRVIDLDFALHVLIARCSGNMVFERIVQSFGDMMRSTWGLYFALPEEARVGDDLVTLHIDLALAVADGDRDRAVAAMTAHFAEVVSAFAS